MEWIGHMIIFPAIDLVGGKAVRLLRGDYAQSTVYDDDPLNTARAFESAGAEYVHVVDLEGARDGGTPNYDTIMRIVKQTSLKVEVGGGIRSMDVVEKYLSSGVSRVILGTAAITNERFAADAIDAWGDRIALGADIREGKVAIRGWTELSELTLDQFLSHFQKLGAKTVICTDVSRDGAMAGTNRALYAAMQARYSMDIVASGGVSTMDDVRALARMGLYGAIIGKAYYIGAIDLKAAIEEAKR